MGGTGDILDYIEATHWPFIEVLVYFLTEFVPSLNESGISPLEILFEMVNQNVELWCWGLNHFSLGLIIGQIKHG